MESVSIPGYRVLGVLGRGGMGTVYLADNLDLPRREAIKVLSAELSADDGFRARFLREADVAADFTHPNIVRVYRRGRTDDGLLWIAMQLVDGADAGEELRRGALGAERSVFIIGEVAKALDYAHARGVIHRDIKPANFLLSGPPGPQERVLLADFGIARALDSAGLTAAGSMVATVAYAAPEVLTGAESDHRADIYSLGCALYQMLTGQPPFPATNGVGSVMMAHLHSPAPKVSAARPDLPPAIDAVIARAMANSPPTATPSAGEFASAATQALYSGATTLAPTIRPAPTPGPPWPSTAAAPPAPRRPRRVAALAAAGVAVLALGVTGGYLLARRGNDAPIAAPAATTAATSTPSTAAPVGPPVPAAQIAPLLLSADQVAAILGVPVHGGQITNGLGADANMLVEKDCAAPWGPALHLVYRDSGWQAVAIQVLNESSPPAKGAGPDFVLPRYAVQSLVAFPDAAAAAAFLAGQVPIWQRCANRTLTFLAQDSMAVPVTLGDLRQDPGPVLVMPQTLQNAGDNRCVRALGVRNNVAIDVTVCNHDPDTEGQAARLVDALAAQVGAAR